MSLWQAGQRGGLEGSSLSAAGPLTADGVRASQGSLWAAAESCTCQQRGLRVPESRGRAA